MNLETVRPCSIRDIVFTLTSPTAGARFTIVGVYALPTVTATGFL